MNPRGAAIAGLLALSLLATAALAHEEIPRQISDMTAEIQRSPGDAGLYLRRGELYRIHREWEAARADYARARRLDPGLALVHFCEARMHMDAGDPGGALAEVERFLAAAPGAPAGLAVKGDALAALARHAEAARAYDDAIRARVAEGGRPAPELFIARARAWIAAGPANAETALAGLEEGLALLGLPVTLDIEALEIEVGSGRIGAALDRVDRLAARSPGKEGWLARKAEILAGAGRSAEAAGAYREALRAIEELPGGKRRLPAIERLEAGLRAGLASLPEPASPAPAAAPGRGGRP